MSIQVGGDIGQARCIIALGYDCDMVGAYADGNAPAVTHGRLSAEVIAYLQALCRVAEERGGRLQLFVQGMTLEEPCEYLREAVARGHAVDQHTYSHLPLTGDDLGAIESEVARSSDAFEAQLGYRPAGLRAPGMYRNGLQDHPRVQEALARQGIEWVSSDYSTRPRSHPHDKAADDNAARNLKHLQPRWYPTGGHADGPRLLEIPAPGYSDRHFLDAMCGSLEEWTAHQRACIEFAYSLGGLAYAPDLHPHTHLRHDPDLRAIRAALDYAGSLHEPVAVCTHEDLYRRAARETGAPSASPDR